MVCRYSLAVACYCRALSLTAETPSPSAAPTQQEGEKVEVIIDVGDDDESDEEEPDGADDDAREARLLEARRTRATLFSNTAMALLKMKTRATEALAACADAPGSTSHSAPCARTSTAPWHSNTSFPVARAASRDCVCVCFRTLQVRRSPRCGAVRF